jgi:hypothetical protein
MLCGDGWVYLRALVVPDVASREAKAAARVTAEQAEKKGQAAVDQLNARLPAKLRWGGAHRVVDGTVFVRELDAGRQLEGVGVAGFGTVTNCV